MTSTGPRRGRRSTCLHPLRDWPAMYACRLRASLSAPAGGLPAPLPSVPASFSGNHDRARRRLPCKFLRTRGGLSVCFPGTAAVLSVIGLWAWALSMWRSGGRWVLVTAAISLAYPSHVGCHRLRVVFRAAMGAVFRAAPDEMPARRLAAACGVSHALSSARDAALIPAPQSVCHAVRRCRTCRFRPTSSRACYVGACCVAGLD